MRSSIIAVLLVLASVHVAGTALADTRYEGHIMAGHPVTYMYGGVTESVTPCDPSSPLTGVDGAWFDITGAGTTFTLEMDATLDADVWFYDATCAFIMTLDGTEEGEGTTETGAVPANAAFAVVDGFWGTGAFTLTISG